MKEPEFKNRTAVVGAFHLTITNDTEGDVVKFGWSISCFSSYPHGVRIGCKDTEAAAEKNCVDEFRKLIEPTLPYMLNMEQVSP